MASLQCPGDVHSVSELAKAVDQQVHDLKSELDARRSKLEQQIAELKAHQPQRTKSGVQGLALQSQLKTALETLNRSLDNLAMQHSLVARKEPLLSVLPRSSVVISTVLQVVAMKGGTDAAASTLPRLGSINLMLKTLISQPLTVYPLSSITATEVLDKFPAWLEAFNFQLPNLAIATFGPKVLLCRLKDAVNNKSNVEAFQPFVRNVERGILLDDFRRIDEIFEARISPDDKSLWIEFAIQLSNGKFGPANPDIDLEVSFVEEFMVKSSLQRLLASVTPSGSMSAIIFMSGNSLQANWDTGLWQAAWRNLEVSAAALGEAECDDLTLCALRSCLVALLSHISVPGNITSLIQLLHMHGMQQAIFHHTSWHLEELAMAIGEVIILSASSGTKPQDLDDTFKLLLISTELGLQLCPEHLNSILSSAVNASRKDVCLFCLDLLLKHDCKPGTITFQDNLLFYIISMATMLPSDLTGILRFEIAI